MMSLYIVNHTQKVATRMGQYGIGNKYLRDPWFHVEVLPWFGPAYLLILGEIRCAQGNIVRKNKGRPLGSKESAWRKANILHFV